MTQTPPHPAARLVVRTHVRAGNTTTTSTTTTTTSNVMKSRHDTAKNAISNIR